MSPAVDQEPKSRCDIRASLATVFGRWRRKANIALTVGRPKDRARLVYLVSLESFDRPRFAGILDRYHLRPLWQEWAVGLGLDPSLRDPRT